MAKRAFRPGFKWRILAHKPTEGGWWLCHYCGWKGQDLDKHPKKCEGSLGAFDFERMREDKTRRIVHSSTVDLDSEDFAEPVEFDELVIDQWFHLEQMNDRDWWIGIGDPDNGDYYHVNVHIDGDKKVTVHVEDESRKEE